jgi:molybdopterin-binding protein
MKISARNRLQGNIVEVKRGVTTAHVRIDVGGTVVTARSPTRRSTNWA